MRTKLILATLFLTFIGIAAQAQEPQPSEPKGKAIVQVFANFHTGFGAENDDRGFELDRSYLGYEYQLTKGLSVKGVMDIGQSKSVDDYHRSLHQECDGVVEERQYDAEWRSDLDHAVQFPR